LLFQYAETALTFPVEWGLERRVAHPIVRILGGHPGIDLTPRIMKVRGPVVEVVVKARFEIRLVTKKIGPAMTISRNNHITI
jgi:hypothetical protein